MKIHDPTTAVLLLILGQALAVDATFSNGLSHQNISIDMIESSKINAIKPIVGNSTIFPVHINVLMPIIRLPSVDLHIHSY